MQDVIVLLVGHGFDLHWLLDLDLLSFDSLVSSYSRISISKKIEDAWTMLIASQAPSKEMKKWTKRWEDSMAVPKALKNRPKKNQMAEFLAKYGKGF